MFLIPSEAKVNVCYRPCVFSYAIKITCPEESFTLVASTPQEKVMSFITRSLQPDSCIFSPSFKSHANSFLVNYLADFKNVEGKRLLLFQYYII